MLGGGLDAVIISLIKAGVLAVKSEYALMVCGSLKGAFEFLKFAIIAGYGAVAFEQFSESKKSKKESGNNKNIKKAKKR